jgi:hypothetical protein
MACLAYFTPVLKFQLAVYINPSIRERWHYFETSGGRSVGIVRSRTKATEFSSFSIYKLPQHEKLLLYKLLVILITISPSFLKRLTVCSTE